MSLRDVATGQCGVFTREQALAAGFSRKRILARLRCGQWTRVVGRAYVVTGTAVDHLVRCWAACLDAGPAAVVTGPSALRLHGLQVEDDTVHLSSVRLRPRGRPGVRVHQTSIDAAEIVCLEGLFVADRVRALTDTLRSYPAAAGEALLDDALRRRWLTSGDLARQARRFTGSHGAPTLVAHVAAGATGAVFPAERLLHRLLRSSGIGGWVANAPVHDRAGLVGVVDVLVPAARLALEVDGRAYHVAARRFQADRTKQNRLVAAGYVVLRFTWDDLVNRPDAVTGQVAATLARASVLRESPAAPGDVRARS